MGVKHCFAFFPIAFQHPDRGTDEIYPFKNSPEETELMENIASYESSDDESNFEENKEPKKLATASKKRPIAEPIPEATAASEKKPKVLHPIKTQKKSLFKPSQLKRGPNVVTEQIFRKK